MSSFLEAAAAWSSDANEVATPDWPAFARFLLAGKGYE
ncbi:hypothetical protein [Deinococcus hopiensis]